jgi:hypothetical protein
VTCFEKICINEEGVEILKWIREFSKSFPQKE